MRRILALVVAIAGIALAAQPPRGTLSYRSGGRSVELRVIDGNHPAFISLRPEQGELALLREYFLTHTGPERMIAADASTLKQSAPAAWKVAMHRGARMIRTGDATYWCYTPGLVLPTAFRIGRAEWRLQSADLPPLMFVELR